MMVRTMGCCRWMMCRIGEILWVQRGSNLHATVSLGGELLLGLAMMLEQRWGRASRYMGDSSREDGRHELSEAGSSELGNLLVLGRSMGHSRCRGDLSWKDGRHMLSGAR